MAISKFSLHKITTIDSYLKAQESKLKQIEYVNENFAKVTLKNKTTDIVRNFYEYHIDEVLLLSLMNDAFWGNKKSISYHKDFQYNYFWCGYIGSFGYQSDIIKLLSMKGERSHSPILTNHEMLKKYSKLQDEADLIEFQRKAALEFDRSKKTLYTSMWGAWEYADNFDFKVDFDDDFVYWEFIDEETNLNWKFDRSQYTSIITMLLDFYMRKY
ncbi:MAG: hypothetical protein P1U56_18325 [Saprospiraceae bacterium]|nr:hypothetical protein [Saprospiraceae bacterium]